jgi:hypothetical protein
VGAAPGLESEKLLSWWGGLLLNPSAAWNVSLAVFWAIQRRCLALQQWRMFQYPPSPGMVCHRPSRVTRLGSAFSVITINMWWGGLNVYAGDRPFSAGRCSFPDSWPPLLSASPLSLSRHSDFLGDFCVPLVGLSSRFQRQSFYAFHLHRYSRSGPVLHSSSIPIALHSFVRWGRLAPPECLGANLVGPGG